MNRRPGATPRCRAGLWVALFAPGLFAVLYSFLIGCRVDQTPFSPNWVGLFVPVWIAMLPLASPGLIYICVHIKKKRWVQLFLIIVCVSGCWTFMILYPLALEGYVAGDFTFVYIPLYVSTATYVLYVLITKC